MAKKGTTLTNEQKQSLNDNLAKAREARKVANKMANLDLKGFYNLSILATLYKPYGISRADLQNTVNDNMQIKRIKAGTSHKFRLGDIVSFLEINPLADSQ